MTPTGTHDIPDILLQTFARPGVVYRKHRVASHVKDAIKAYEQSTSLPYDHVPQELCLARAETRSVDLSGWSLLVNDTALRCIAAEDKKRIDGLARRSGVNKVLFTKYTTTRRTRQLSGLDNRRQFHSW